MNNNSRTLLGLAFIALLALLPIGGCGRGGGALPPSPVVTESFRTDDDKNVAIRTDALNREFLFQGNLIRLEGAQKFDGLKSRIVVFQKQAGKLFMLESQEGHTVTPDTPFALILADFPIVREENGWIYFDFNQGMSKIFTTADMYPSDFNGTGYQPSFEITPVMSSYLSEVDVSHLNRLALRQSAQVPNPVNTLTSVEVRYYISPYLPDKSFKPTPSPGFTNAGYFEVMPQLLSGGETKVLAMKWNLNNKPVTYYLSANTPPEYRQAVKNGVLYWNTTLGEEIFAVADAPQGVTAPDMDRNIIQWVDFDNADSAYADIQADPRTGEILHAQVFMPSTFAVGGKKTAWQLLYMLANLPSPSSNSLISLRNMYSPRVCDLDARNRMIKGITTLLAENSADDVILRVSQAVVQEVVTHEVGHTMGLRHNFAGSLAADYAGHSREELSANFLNGGPYIKVTPSSSIMDYHDNTEAILAVNRFDVEKKALEHDTRSMRFLYRNEPLDKSIPYCTDSDLDTLDCRKFDYGNSPLAYASSELRNNLSVDVLPVKLFLNMAVEVMGGKSVTELNPSPAANATALLDNKAVLLTAFTQDGFYSRTLKRQYPGNLLKDVDKTELRKAVVPDVLTDLDAWLLSNPYGIKSAKEMFMIIDPAWKDAWIARFNQITNNPAFYNFVDPNGVTRTFTPAEREQLRTMATGFFADLIPALVTADVKQMSLPSKIDIVDGKAGEGLLGTMNATSNTYLMAREPGESLKVTVNGASLFLPVFGYDWPLRQDASRLLNNRTVPGALWWGIQETAANEASLTALLDSAVSAAGGAFSSAVVANGFTGAGSVAYEWYLENTKVVKEGF